MVACIIYTVSTPDLDLWKINYGSHGAIEILLRPT